MSTRTCRYGRTGAWLATALVALALLAPGAGAEPAFPLAPGRPSAGAPAPLFPLVGGRRAALPGFLLRRGAPAAARGANPHGDITVACESCHTPTGWRPLRERPDFSHDRQTAFPLTGRHEQTTCRSCHLDLRFDQPDVAPNDCASCHLDVHRGQLGTDCQQCHTTQDFGTVRGVEVHARTAFPLTGAHLQIACEACHADGGRAADGAFTPLDPTCVACHAADYAATSASLVDHAGAGFPTTCEACHSTLSFRTGVAFDHAAVSGGFGLVGAHAALTCASCHQLPGLTPIFQPASQEDCATCHADDHAAAHPAFPTTCQTCHSTTSFAGASFDHGAQTGFPLVGAHVTADCASCHALPGFEPLFQPADANDCATCHADDHAAVHPTFPTTCTTCHGTSTWAASGFDHGAVTGFPLTGVHTPLACASCHTVPGFEPLFEPAGPEDCATCHADDHAAAHPSFPTTCATCHQPDTWTGGSFDHQGQTGFPLVGAHQALACSNCHTGPDYTPIFEPADANDCLTCHTDDHAAAHPAFPTTCTTCHSTSSWDGASFDHGAQTGFPLVGVHQTVDCASCHVLPTFEPIYTPAGPEDCATCHADDHAAAHPSFPTTCATCHQPDTWAGASFDHVAVTGFPLVGVHAPLACESCHTGPEYTPIYDPADANDCYACHQDDHTAAHPSFPQTCSTCHQPNTWAGGSFNHGAATGFNLVGAHQPLPCTACHTLPDYTPIFNPANENDCYACHQADYQAEHAGTGFPTTCSTCHNTNTWQGATFNHDPFFPIYSGEHEGEWNTCQDCHTQPGNYQVFSCITCHAHRRSEMDDEHDDVGGYTYQSQACFNCHPRGEADRPGFDPPDRTFRLVR